MTDAEQPDGPDTEPVIEHIRFRDLDPGILGQRSSDIIERVVLEPATEPPPPPPLPSGTETESLEASGGSGPTGDEE
jgi:hypothetical protein